MGSISLGLLATACFDEPEPVPQDDTTTGVSTSTDDGRTETTMVAPETTVDPDTTATDTESDSTTSPPAPCLSDDDCTDPSLPFCSPELTECGTCSQMPDPDEACAGLDPSLPVCSDGVCAQCSEANAEHCTGATPACDPATGTCVPCSAHEQCGDSACNLFTGSCVQGLVVTVGPGQQYPTLALAVEAVVPGGGGTIVVHEALYDEAVTVDGDAVVAFLANGADRPQWYRTAGVAAPQLRATSGATVLIDGLDLRLNDAATETALRVDGGMLWLDRGILAQNAGGALSVEASGSVMVRNSFVAGPNDLAAIELTSASVILQYTTVGAGFGGSAAIACDGASTVEVSDSILVSRGAGPEVDCLIFLASHTASNTTLPDDGDNVEVGPTMNTWFTSYDNGDFHLTALGQTVFMDVAEWNDGEPTVDIDGEARSGVGGTPEHAGADLP